MMTLQATMNLEDMVLDRVVRMLRVGLEINSGLEEKKKLVKSILPSQKYKLMEKFLTNITFSVNVRLKCLSIFLDDKTKYFEFMRFTINTQTVKSILEIIAKNCPNIEIINFTNLAIGCENIENFKYLLKKSNKLKSLRVRCRLYNDCAINKLLLQDDFKEHDLDVQNGLRKIEHINSIGLSPAQCAKLLNLLPNLKCLGMNSQSLGPFLNYYIDNNDNDPKRLINITEFADQYTSLTALDLFVEYCPNATRIFLYQPEPNVIERLANFSLLTDVKIFSEYFDEILNLIKNIGRQIKTLRLHTGSYVISDPISLREFCPELEILKVNYEKF